MDDEALVRLLAWQTARYTSGDSSVSAEAAGELLAGLRCTLSMAPPALTRGGDLVPLWRAGQAELVRAMEEFRALHARACLEERGFGSRAYADTLRSLAALPKKYDRLYFPHIIPCDIDYQLSHPVSEELAGLAYVNEWLRRLIVENEFLSRFEEKRVRRLLLRLSPDYRELIINLYEPAAANALGLALLGENASTLLITSEQRAALCGLFEPLPPSPAIARLEEAAATLARSLALDDSGREYLALTARELYPRVAASLETGLRGVFI